MKRKKDEPTSIGVGQLYPGLSSFDYSRLVEWMDDPKRKPANTAFTAGCTRDAARAFEEHLSHKTFEEHLSHKTLRLSDAQITTWAERHDLNGTLTDLRAAGEDARSL